MFKKKKDKEKVSSGEGVYFHEGKYHCEDCDHELKVEEVCPTCKKAVDWDKAMAEFRTKGL